ncbi:MAG: hypothetical protein L0Y66_03565 [Myxococcaceae bacterium]|nr:hypothetical protein [Myxococcaceae bacterium]MCI0673548.1 hypothetical protein [Myxococcaceae bacterium]
MLTPRKLLALGAAVVAGLAVLLLWPGRNVPAEEQVRRRMVQMAAAAEERNLGDVMEGVSDSFRSTEGWGKDDLRRVLAAQLLRGQWVRIFLDVDAPTQVSGDEVAVSARLFFARSDAEDLAHLARESVVDAYAVEGTFRREADGEWRAVQASHRRLGAADLL